MAFCLPVSLFSSQKDTRHIRGRAILLQDDILTNYVCNDPISKYGHSHLYWALGFNISFWGTRW